MIGNGVPRNDFHIFPFRTQIETPRKGENKPTVFFFYTATGLLLLVQD